MQHAPVRGGQRRDHVDFRDVDGEDQTAAELCQRDALGLKVVDGHSAVDTLLHGDDLLRRFLCDSDILWGILAFLFNYL